MNENKWSTQQILFYLLIVTLGVLLRFLFLDIRPLHHDESLHAQYGHYFFDSPSENFYRYNPLLHGPLLYHLLPYVYWIFGPSQSALRLLPALAGSLLIFLPITVKKYFRPSYVILATLIVSLSPTYTYWSRFLNHDMLVVLFMSITLTLFLAPKISPKIRLPLLGIVIALQYCLKANAYLHFFVLISLLFFDYLFHFRHKQRSLAFKFYEYLRRNLTTTVVSLVLATLVFAYFFTAGWKHPDGFLDGLYRESLTYWWGQHKTERITGPFLYYFLVLFLYEPLFLFILSIVPFEIFKRSRKHFTILTTASLLISTVILFLPNELRENALKLKLNTDSFIFSFLLLFFIGYCAQCYREKNYRLGQVAFLFGAFTTIYSYAGEKVPWLALYPLFFSFCFLLARINDYYKNRIFKWTLAILLMIGLGKNLFINFVRPGSANEIISQVHTSAQFEQTVKLLDVFIENKNRSFLVHPQMLWPTSWYMYYSNHYSHIRGRNQLEAWDYIMAPTYDRDYFQELYENYDYTILTYRQWWEPDYQAMNPVNVIRTFLTHTPWNPPERAYIYLYERKEFKREFLELMKSSD